MNSRERVLTSLRHKQPDRLPVAYNGAEGVLAEKIHDHYQVPGELALWLKLGVDFWPINVNKYTMNWQINDRSNVLAKVSTVSEIEEFFAKNRPEYDYRKMFAEQQNPHADKFRQINGGSLFAYGWAMWGFERILEDFYLNPELVEAILEGLLNEHLELLENVLSRFNAHDSERKIDMVFLSDDMGTQEDLIFSPDIYRRFLKPRLSKLASIAHKYGAVAALHSCGSVHKLIPDLIDTGIDILNPVQTSAKGMEPERLKREFGSELTFWGGVDTQTVFSRGTPDHVREEVRKLKNVMGEDGGYFCSPTHVLTAEVPLENVIAFFEEAFVEPKE